MTQIGDDAILLTPGYTGSLRAMAPRLSILIPTRNRPAMAAVAVRCALDAAGVDDEVVVADNGDAPLSLDLDDRRLRVLRADRVYPMPDNWERVIRDARGESLLLLSDKHRLVPGSVARLLSARERPDDVVTYALATFVQNVPSADVERASSLAEAAGTLHYAKGPRHARRRSSRETLADWYRTMRYQLARPMLYSAIIPRRIVDDVVRRHGRFLHGVAPDVASSLQILAETDSYVETDIAGTVIHFPTWDPRWSSGASMSTGGTLGNGFLREFGSSPLGRLPPLAASAVYQTLLACARLRPGSAPSESRLLQQFAREAAAEVELSKRADRAAMHRAIFAATQAAGAHPASVLAQLQSVVYAQISPALRQRVRRLIGRQEASGPATPPRACADLKEALDSVASENRQAETPTG